MMVYEAHRNLEISKHKSPLQTIEAVYVELTNKSVWRMALMEEGIAEDGERKAGDNAKVVCVIHANTAHHTRKIHTSVRVVSTHVGNSAVLVSIQSVSYTHLAETCQIC